VNVVLLVLLCVLSAVVFVQLGALIELFRQVQQIRIAMDLEDRRMPLSLGKAQGVPASAVGLPEQLDGARAAMVLFLSNKCATCHSLAAALRGAVPMTMWIVVEPVFGDDAEPFVEEFQLAGERTLIDRGGQISGRLGLSVTPSAIFIEDGRLHRAETVPSSRQLFSMMPVVQSLGPPTPIRAEPAHGRHDDSPLSRR
jgi:hypothetical protein